MIGMNWRSASSELDRDCGNRDREVIKAECSGQAAPERAATGAAIGVLAEDRATLLPA